MDSSAGDEGVGHEVSENYLLSKYHTVREIGRGSFGHTFLAINRTNNKEVAIKMESSTQDSHLLLEIEVYKVLRGGVGIPNIHCYCQGEHYNFLVMDLLGPSLLDQMKSCLGRFTLKTVLMLADQMIQLIEYVHNKNIIHGDIKPDNFLMGLNSNSNLVYLIDFGLAKSYLDPRTGTHISYRKDMEMEGNARYASINVHRGIEQSRRDDMMSLGYVLMHFLRGNLPWQGLEASIKDHRNEMVKEKKISTSVEDLCENYPRAFARYFYHCRELRFAETPDYMYLRRQFRDLFKESNYHNEKVFDWTVLEQKAVTITRTLASNMAVEGTPASEC